MSADERRDDRPRWRERAAVVAMALFPLLVAGGFFAPGVVHLIAIAQTDDPGPPPSITDTLGPFARRPLLVPRDFSAGFIPELLDLDQLFASEGFRFDPDSQRLARLSAFPRSHSEGIVIDDDGFPRFPIVFADALMDELPREFALNLVDPFGHVNPLCGALGGSNCVRYDDLVGGGGGGPGTPIPEPGTALLLAAGLASLASRRSR